MNLIPQTTFTGTPDDIKSVIDAALAPQYEILAELIKRIQPLPELLSVSRIAQDCSCSSSYVRRWIIDGRTIPGKDKIVKLKVVDGLTDSMHLVRREDYEEFLNHFPSIRY